MNAGGAAELEEAKPFFASGLFFDAHQRTDMMRLYRFVRAAREYASNKDMQSLQDLITKWHALSDVRVRELEHGAGDDANTRHAKTIARLKIMHGFDPAWVDAFLLAQLVAIKPKKHKTLDDSLTYVYGSAEVLGLMAAGMLRLPKAAREAAKLEGRAIQWAMFLRDIGRDAKEGRNYFPQDDLRRVGLKDLQEKTARAQPDEFKDFMKVQLGRYHQWQLEAMQDVGYVPRRQRVVVNTAIHGYNYIAKQIARNPFVVYERSVAPSRTRLTLAAFSHSFD